LNALGFLGSLVLQIRDTALCGFAGASPGFTCIDHTACCDCLAAAKSTKTKCAPISESKESKKRSSTQRFVAEPANQQAAISRQTCQVDLHHKQQPAAGSRPWIQLLPMRMHLPPARFGRNLSGQGRQCFGYKEGAKAEEEKEWREHSTRCQRVNWRITDPGVREFCGLPPSAECTCRNCFTKFAK
jgi:hypothetical protein